MLLRISFLFGLAAVAFGQYPYSRQPLQVVNISSITATTVLDCAPAIGVIDNRSTISRANDYDSFIVTGTGVWSVTMNYSDNSCTGPWNSFGAQASITNSSSVPWIGWGQGYHPFLQFVITGNAVANYAATRNIYYPENGGGGGGGFVWMGPWSSSTTYAINAVVSFGGSTYIATASSTNQEPDTSPLFWQVFIPGGATGTAGGDLSGTYPNPTVVGIDGTSLLGITGILKITAGVPSAAVGNTDYVATLPPGIVVGNGSATGSSAVPGVDYTNNLPTGVVIGQNTAAAAAGVTAGSGLQYLRSNSGNTGYEFATVPGGSVTTTGSPANGNLAVFSGASSITNGNLSGDASTFGGTALTLATVSSTSGVCGNATTVCQVTTNAKGLVTQQVAVPISLPGPTTNQNIRSVKFTFGDFSSGASAISGTHINCQQVDFGGLITGVSLIGSPSGSATVDVQTVATASFTGPSSATTITASDTPALSSATAYTDTTLTGWTTAIAANTTMCFVLSSPATATGVTIDVRIGAN